MVKENDAKVSIFKYIHNIYIVLNGDSLKITDPTKTIKKVTIVTVIINCKNFLILSIILLPCLII